MDAGSGMVVVRGWGVDGRRSHCFMNEESQFGKMEGVHLVTVLNAVGVLDATELQALKRLRWQVHS